MRIEKGFQVSEIKDEISRIKSKLCKLYQRVGSQNVENKAERLRAQV